MSRGHFKGGPGQPLRAHTPEPFTARARRVGALPRGATDLAVSDLAEWKALSETTRREVIRGTREHTRCDGDWHGREDLSEAGKLACRILKRIGDAS